MQTEARPEAFIPGVRVKWDAEVPMRDGTILRADVYRPDDNQAHPVLLLRTPYDKTFAQNFVYQHPSWYARHGYVVVIQDNRGRNASDGEFYPLRNEALDGFDTIEWAAALEGTTGAVGTYGFSYPGAVQLLAAAEQPPSLACCIPGFTGSDFFDGWTYRGGAFHNAFIIAWVMQFLAIPDALKRGDRESAARLAALGGNLKALYAAQPLRDFAPLREAGVADYFFDWLEHDTRDDYWKEISLQEHGRYDRIDVPCLHVVGWYDTFVEGTVTNFSELFVRADGDPSRTQRLLVGPWLHIPWGRLNGARNFGPEADNPIDGIQLAWFDHWLKGDTKAAPEGPVARIFVMGENAWRDADAWPPSEAQVEEWYLHSSGRALSVSGDGTLSPERPDDESPDVYAYLPVAPAPSLGGNSCCLPEAAPMGSFEQTSVEVRNDVLVYSTAPLERDVEVTGSVELVLHAATDVVDTDWTAKLVDVCPDGCAWNICDGIVRARFRESLEEPKLLEPGRTYEYRIRVGVTSNLFKRGHRIRLEISSSNFPLHDVNTNTGARVKDATLLDSVVATQVVYHDAKRPSRLLLPVVPR